MTAPDPITAERAAVVAHLHAKATEVRGMAHTMGDDEADHLARRIDALAEGIEAGLHLELPEARREEVG